VGDERIRAASQSEELAWAAGFWDGEGSCGCYGKNDGRKRRASDTYLRASVNQNEREPLDRFLAVVGMGKIYGPYQRHEGNPYWSYQLAGKSAELLLGRLWPWLSGPKRRQYLAAKKKFEQRPEPAVQGLGGTKPCPPGCTCGRHTGWWSTHSKDEAKSTEHRRAQQREYTRRYRERKKGTA
jgi:hypothetical protein